MKRFRPGSRILSVLLAAALLLVSLPTGILSIHAFAESSKLTFGVMSDIHYYPKAYFPTSGVNAAFEEWSKAANKEYINEDGLLDSALAAFEAKAKSEGLSYVIIPGDLTHNGEYQANVELAKKLEAFEKESGLQVLVINGNHDINNGEASSFANGESAVPARATTPEEFRSIYKDLGYDLATATYTPPEGTKAGMLSYAVELNGYRLIFIDGGKYSADSTASGKDEHETGGNYTPALLNWVKNQISEAGAKGETVVGVDHWSLVPHFNTQATVLQSFPLDNYLQVSETLADAGMHYIITGHSHSDDVSKHVSDNGQALYDIETNSLLEFPNAIRTVSFTNNGDGTVKLDYNTLDCDCVKPVVGDDGTIYQQPYRQTFSFNYIYGSGMTNYATTALNPMLTGLLKAISDEGGIVKYISSRIDLEAMVKKYLGSFSDKAMTLINDLGKQIDTTYINNPEYTVSVVDKLADEIISMQISDKPCMTLHDEYGYGDSSKGGTLGDLVLVCMVQMWRGNEDVTNDAFMKDVNARLEDGTLSKQIFDKLYSVFVDELAQKQILSNLYVQTDELYKGTKYENAGGYVQFFTDLAAAAANGTATAKLQEMVQNIMAGGKKDNPAYDDAGFKKATYLELINSALYMLDKTGNLKGGSIDGVLQNMMSEYLTQSQYESWGHTLATTINDFTVDTDPAFLADRSGSYLYAGAETVPVTQDNYRSPSLISESFGDSSNTSMNISWYTKYSLTAADIEVIPYSDTPVFTGQTSYPNGVNVDASTVQTDRSFPGVDLGTVGFMDYTQHLQRHIAKITGLESGKKYLYRVGDAARGWWSAVGVITTADGTDSVTFLHMTDCQGQNEKQYAVYANVVNNALKLYPNAAFIANSGDMVDNGANLNYWKDYFNCTTKMMALPTMPVSGNHEAKGDNSLVNDFVLPSSAEQDTKSGYYYSYDYNNVHFIMLNTNDLNSVGLSPEQLAWLSADAIKTDAQWKVVVLHKSIYSDGSHYADKEVKALRAQLQSLMPALGIDLVLEGHDHAYLRTDEMNGNKIVSYNTKTLQFEDVSYTAKVDPKGTIYADSGAAGCKSYLVTSEDATDKYFPRAEKTVATSLPVFSAIRVVDNALYFDAYTVDGDTTQKIDSFAILKETLRGDANKDGAITTDDARIILQAATGITGMTRDQKKAYDINNDGAVTTDDARLVLRKAAGLISY